MTTTEVVLALSSRPRSRRHVRTVRGRWRDPVRPDARRARARTGRGGGDVAARDPADGGRRRVAPVRVRQLQGQTRGHRRCHLDRRCGDRRADCAIASRGHAPPVVRRAPARRGRPTRLAGAATTTPATLSGRDPSTPDRSCSPPPWSSSPVAPAQPPPSRRRPRARPSRRSPSRVRREREPSTLVAPPTGQEQSGAFLYPEDGSAVRVGAGTASVTAQPGLSSSAQAIAQALAISLFGGELVAESVSVRATAAAGAVNATADASQSSVTGLLVLGQPQSATPGLTLPLGDWGTLDVLARRQRRGRGAEPPGDRDRLGSPGHADGGARRSSRRHGDRDRLGRRARRGAKTRNCPPGAGQTRGHAEADHPDGRRAAAGARGLRSVPGAGRADPTRAGGRRAAAVDGRVRVPRVGPRPRSATRSARSGPTSPVSGTTARTSSPPTARPSSPLPTERCSPSGGTTSAAGGCGFATPRATSSTTHTSPPTRRSPSRARPSRPVT